MALQRSVAEQNAATRDEILAAARLFAAAAPRLQWLAPCLLGHGLAPEAGLLVALSSRVDQGGDDVQAVWLTDAGRFWRIDALVPRDGSAVEIEAIADVTDATQTSAPLRGTGRSFGRLALDVQAELRPAG